MTVLTADAQLLGTGRPTLPRVNLLPPEIAEKQALRRLQMCMGAAVVGSLAVVGLLYASASHSVSSAQGDLDAAKSQQTTLQQQVQSYAGVTALYAAADQAQAQLGVAMGDEIRYSQLLNDLSLAIPSNVWVTNLSYTQAAPTGPVAGVAVGPTSSVPKVGSATFTGVAFSHDDVATWLDAMAKLPTYMNAYFTNSVEALLGNRVVVNFSSTVDLTPTAQSHRYTKPVGG